MARRVAADIGRPEAANELVELLDRFLAQLALGRRIGEAERQRMRREGGAAARAGEPIQAAIDRYLTAGWVVWETAVEIATPGDQPALMALGGILLRAGDDVAASLAEGFSAAEAALAARGGAMRRAVVDELLSVPPGTGASVARLGRRAALVGFDPARPVRIVVARAEQEVDEAGSIVEVVEGALARGPRGAPVLVAPRAGDIVLLLGERAGTAAETVAAALAAPGAFGPEGWWAVHSDPVPLDRLASTYADAVDSLRVIGRVGPRGEVVDLGDVVLERAMTADRTLASAAVDRWLGPLERSPRSGAELVDTLDAWFAAGVSVTGAARSLHVAPRTVSYRLERIARLLGRDELDAETRLRLAAALLLRRLVSDRPPPAAAASIGRWTSG